MRELEAEHTVHLADLELRFLQAIRAAVPAAFDKNAGSDYTDRVAELLEQIES